MSEAEARSAKPDATPTVRRATQLQDGFSLMELLVVLAIMSVVMSVIGVQVGNAVRSAEFRDTVLTMEADIQRARLDTLTRGRPLALYAGEDHALASADPSVNDNQIRRYEPHILTLPTGWTASGQALVIDVSGQCGGARWALRSPDGRTIELNFQPGDCRRDAVSSVAQ